jgi:putative transposase
MIQREQANYSVRLMCEVLGVSPSGYYAWRTRPRSPRQEEDARVCGLISGAHGLSRGTYGVPRMQDELRYAHGVRCSRKRVARLMRFLGLQGVHRRRGKRTTTRTLDTAPAPDLVKRNFQATAPGQLLVGDITYIPTWAGFLFLAVVMDAFTRMVVGWSMANDLGAEVVHNAFAMARAQGRAPGGAIHHSDSEYGWDAGAFRAS